MSKRNSKFKTIAIFVIVLLVLASVIGLISKFTSVGDTITDLFDTTFRVEYNGVVYTGNNNIISLSTKEQPRFNVKTLNSYSVSIKPNVTALSDFVYTVDGVPYKFSETNLSRVFFSEGNIQSDYFTLNNLDSWSIESVLSKLYEGHTVLVDVDIGNPYLLTVTSAGVTIKFVIVYVANVVLDSEHIYF